MLFVDLNDTFSCKEFDRLLCNCSVKGYRENTMRKNTRLVCDVTLPATGEDKTDNLHIGYLTKTPCAPTYNGFHLFQCFYSPLGKKAVKRSREIGMSVPEFSAGGDAYHSCREQRRSVVHKAATHKT